MKKGAIWAFIAILVIGCIFWGMSGLNNTIERESARGSSSYNVDEEGTAGLHEWLTELGYATERMEYVEWEFEEDVDAVLIVNPLNRITDDELDTVVDWVRNSGGTLIISGAEPNVLDRYNIIFEEGSNRRYDQRLLQPLDNPALVNLPQESLPISFTLRRQDIAVIAALNVPEDSRKTQPTVLAIAEGAGMVYLVLPTAPLTNEGLRNPEYGALVQNLLSRVPEGGRIVFDEIHHGRPAPVAPPNAEPYSPLAIGLIYVCFAGILWGLANGRRFGNLVPSQAEVQRRSTTEYVESMASLLRRGRQYGYILAHYKQSFKRRLAKPHGIQASLPDEQFAYEISRYTTIDSQQLQLLLRELSNKNPGAEGLVTLVAAADRFATAQERRSA